MHDFTLDALPGDGDGLGNCMQTKLTADSTVSGDTNVSTMCKHAVCGACDTMLTQVGHVQCPMCRAPRRPQALPFSMCQNCRLCAVP